MDNNFQQSMRTLILANVLALSFSSIAVADNRYTFEAVYNAEYWSNLNGGIDEDDAYMDMLDLTMEVDTGAAFGLEGGTLFGYVLYTNSETFCEKIVGDALVVGIRAEIALY